MRFFNFLSMVSPFIIGLVTGGLLFYFVKTWGIALEDLVQWLAISSSVLVSLAILCWFLFKFFTNETRLNFLAKMKSIARELETSPTKLSDPDYRKNHIWPLLPSVAKVVGSWFGFNSALALLIAVVANLVLLATLSVQYLSAQRLESQNTLLSQQNQVIALQTDLLKTQARAAQIEQSLALDNRLSVIRKTHEELLRVSEASRKGSNAEIVESVLQLSMPVVNYQFDPCLFSDDPKACASANVWQIAEAYEKHPGGEVKEYPHPWYPAFELVAGYIRYRNDRFLEATREIVETNQDTVRDALSYVGDLIARIGEQCALEPQLTRDISVRISIARLLESNAQAYGSGKFQKQWKTRADQFDQVRRNLSRYHTGFFKGVQELATIQRKSYQRSDYTVAMFSTDLFTFYSELDTKLGDAILGCESEVDRLIAAQEKLEE